MAQEMNLWTRLKSDSPAFFKKVIKVAMTIGATATAVLIAIKTVPGLTVPEIVDKLAQYLIVAGVVATAVAKTTMDDTAVAKAEVEKVQDKAEEKIQVTVDDAKSEIDTIVEKKDN